MASVMPAAIARQNQNWSLIQYLRVMYYFGFLPFAWVSEKEPKYFEIKFTISIWKTVTMLVLDMVLALLIPTYFYLFSILNVNPNISPKEVFSPSYFLAMNDGVVTTSLSQFAYIFSMMLGAWTISFTGKSIFLLI